MLPLVLNIEKLNFLVIGFGGIGKRKYQHLIDSGVQVSILTPEVVDLKPVIQGVYDAKHLEGFTHVIAATNDDLLNNKIVLDCQSRNIKVSNVSDVSTSDFFIPAIIRKNQMIISLHSNGKAPGITKMIKDQLIKTFDETLDEKITLIEQLRDTYKKQGLESELKKLYTMTLEELRHIGVKDENKNWD